VYGESAGIGGTGVFGYAAANSGTTYSVRGKVNSPSGWAGYFGYWWTPTLWYSDAIGVEIFVPERVDT
jgi:hypothetical protein